MQDTTYEDSTGEHRPTQFPRIRNAVMKEHISPELLHMILKAEGKLPSVSIEEAVGLTAHSIPLVNTVTLNIKIPPLQRRGKSTPTFLRPLGPGVHSSKFSTKRHAFVAYAESLLLTDDNQKALTDFSRKCCFVTPGEEKTICVKECALEWGPEAICEVVKFAHSNPMFVGRFGARLFRYREKIARNQMGSVHDFYTLRSSLVNFFLGTDTTVPRFGLKLDKEVSAHLRQEFRNRNSYNSFTLNDAYQVETPTMFAAHGGARMPTMPSLNPINLIAGPAREVIHDTESAAKAVINTSHACTQSAFKDAEAATERILANFAKTSGGVLENAGDTGQAIAGAIQDSIVVGSGMAASNVSNILTREILNEGNAHSIGSAFGGGLVDGVFAHLRQHIPQVAGMIGDGGVAMVEAALNGASSLIKVLCKFTEMVDIPISLLRKMVSMICNTFRVDPSVVNKHLTPSKIALMIVSFYLFNRCDSWIIKLLIVVAVAHCYGLVVPVLDLIGLRESAEQQTSDGAITWLIEALSMALAGAMSSAAGVYEVIKTILTGALPTFRAAHVVSLGIKGIQAIFGLVRDVFVSIYVEVRRFLGYQPCLADVLAGSFATTEIQNFVNHTRIYSTEAGRRIVQTNQGVQRSIVDAYAFAARLQEKVTEGMLEGRVPPHSLVYLQTAISDYSRLFDLAQRVCMYGAFRQEPVHLVLTGAPGVGKTRIIKEIMEKVHKKLFHKPAEVYARTTTDHWDGYRGQNFVLMDDCNVVRTVAQAEIVMLYNTCPKILPMADLPDKGTYFTSTAIFSTTNTPYTVHMDIQEPEAVLRRRDLLLEVTLPYGVMTFRKRNKVDANAPIGDTMTTDQIVDYVVEKWKEKKEWVNNATPTMLAKQEKWKEAFEMERAVSATQVLPPAWAGVRSVVEGNSSFYTAAEEEEIQLRVRSAVLQPDGSNIGRMEDTCSLVSDAIARPNMSLINEVETTTTLDSDVRNGNGMNWTVPQSYNSGQPPAPPVPGPSVSSLPPVWDERMRAVVAEERQARNESALAQEVRNAALAAHPELAGSPPTSDLEGGENTALEGQAPTEGTRRFWLPNFVGMTSAGIAAARRMYQAAMTPRASPEGFLGVQGRECFCGDSTMSDFKLVCNHSYHFHCIIKALKLNPTCPECRTPICAASLSQPGSNFEIQPRDFSHIGDQPTPAGQRVYPLLVTNDGVKKTLYEDTVRRMTAHSVPGQGLRYFYYGTESEFEEFKNRRSTFDELGVYKLLDLESVTTLVKWCIEEHDQMSLWGHLKRWVVSVTPFWVNEAFSALFRSEVGTRIAVSVAATTVGLLTFAVVSLAVDAVTNLLFGAKIFYPETTTSRDHFKKEPLVPKKKPVALPVKEKEIATSLPDVTESYDSVEKNILYGSASTGSFNLLAIGGKWLLCNLHCVEPFFDQDYFILTVARTRTASARQVIVYTSHIFKIDNNDAVLMWCDDINEARNIVCRFASVNTPFPRELAFKGKFDDGMGRLNVLDTSHLEVEVLEHPKEGLLSHYGGRRILSYRGYNRAGFSGGIVFNPRSQNGICGIQSTFHGLNNKPTNTAAIVLREDIERIMSQMRSFESEIHPEVTCAPPNPALVGLFENDVSIVGSVPKERVVGMYAKSKIRESPLAKFFHTNRGPAILNPRDHRVPLGSHPAQRSLNKNTLGNQLPLPPDLCQEVVEQTVLFYKSKMDLGTTILNMTDAISLPGSGIPAMKLSTSPGLDLVLKKGGPPGKKGHIVYDDQEGGVAFTSEELVSDVDRMLNDFKNYKIPRDMMFDCLKDELRPLSKVGDARTICVLPLGVNIIYRMYFSMFDQQLALLGNGNNPVCVGIDPERDWTSLYHSLRRVGQWGMEVDVSKWDGRMTCQLAKMHLDVVNAVCDDDGSVVREGVFEYMLHACVQFGDVVYQKYQGMASGFGGTATTNSGCHDMLVRLFYIEECIKVGLDKFVSRSAQDEHLCVRTYGDDMLITFSDTLLEHGIGPWTIANGYAKYGWTVTSASKEKEAGDLIHVDDMQFLKRTFRFDEHMGNYWVHPCLSKDTIYDMCYWLKSDSGFEELINTNNTTALEYMFAYGREDYDEFRDHLNHARVATGRDPIIITYNDMRRILWARISR